MKILLSRTPGWDSPYGEGGALVPLPARMRYLHPAALRSLSTGDASGPFELAGPVTDVFRSPAASLLARRQKRGVQPPGRSAHNFGLAVDLDVGRTLRGRGWTKSALDSWMAQRGWQCYRQDHDPGASEAWHYTYGADGPGSVAVERVIRAAYGHEFCYDDATLQAYLARLGLYDGDLDGAAGGLTLEGVRAFQRSFGVPATGEADSETRRVLAVVAAEKDVRDPQAPAAAPS